MSRFHPPSGFNSRDRSPPQRFGDRRPPAGPRGSDDTSPPFGREPPRGPRALVDSPRGFGGRGRGYGRGEFRDRDRDRDPRDRDREFRDSRDGPPFRRDIDRDWNRRDRDFDSRDNRMGFGRGRSRSPTRDFRDIRDAPSRDFDPRMRRNSRDSILSASSGGPDGPPSAGPHPRGGSMRGRGRGDWEGGRGRGRPPFLDDRDSFRRRSRSRDAWRDRGRDRVPLDRDRDRDRDMDRDRLMDRDRPSDRDRDRDILRDRDRERDLERRERLFDRRDDWDSRRTDREERDRPFEPWKRDHPPNRADPRGPTGPPSAPFSSTSSSAVVTDRPSDQPAADQSRKASTISNAIGPESRRDSERSEPAFLRPEPPKESGITNQNSPPPSAPQVPAFGSVSAPIPSLAQVKEAQGPRASSDAPAQTDKAAPERPSQPHVQPPTGPKADRLESAQSSDLRANKSNSRSPKDETLPTLRAQISERSPPTAPIAMIRRESTAGANDINTPVARSTSLNASPTFSRPPPSAPRAHSREPSISPRMQPSNAPVGSRAPHPRLGSSPRGTSRGNKPWTPPSFSRAPSVSTIPVKKENDDPEERIMPSEKVATEKEHTPMGALDSATDAPNVSPEPQEAAGVTKSPLPSLTDLPSRASPPSQPVPAEKPMEPSPETHEDSKRAPRILVDFGSSDEEDENEVFTQEYLEKRKLSFEKEMELLRSELPPSPLEDQTIVALLLRIQLLGRISQVEKHQPDPAPVPAVEDTGATDVPGIDRVVTFATETIDAQPEPIAQGVIPPVAEHTEITVENLPFLNSGPPTPISEMDVFHENISTQESLRSALSSELSKRQKETAEKNSLLRERYMSYYKPWRLAVWELDRSKDKHMTPGPASPPSPAAPVAPVVLPESREGREGRRYKGNSELDFLNALKASEISAQEELERRRTKMATARPDLSREAVIPDMLEPRDQKAYIFKDVNNTIACEDAKDVFGFLPPPNDFTKEEHEIFTDAFMTYPKRWGKIAEALPNRDFRQCILHYYLTKEEIKYKAKLNKRWSKAKKSQRSRTTRPKSHALIADLGVVKPDVDGEDDPAPVTDTGRPRRAAAPTFGDGANETESPANSRRGQSSRDVGESVDKTAARRGARSAGTRGGARRGRAAQQDPRSQGQQTSQSSTPMPQDPKTEVGADLGVDSGLPSDREKSEKDLQTTLPRSRTGRSGRPKDASMQGYIFESTEVDPPLGLKQTESGYGSQQPTSYWSVPEQRDFPRLLAHFGRDFEGISNFMKTKTTVMKDFEETMMLAEEKKARGEATGPLPVPSVALKRRYEATPSTIVPRPLAPHADLLGDVDEARFSSKSKGMAMSPQPMPLSGRSLLENDRNASRYPPLAQASTTTSAGSVTAPLGEDGSRGMRNSAPSHRRSGPPMGFFTDERRDSLLPHTAGRTQDIPLSSRHPSLAPELARMDPFMSIQQPPSLLPSSHSRHPSLAQAPGSPNQMSRPEVDISSVHRDPFSQRGQYYTLPGQAGGRPQSPRPVLSPVKDAPSRASATPAPEPTPRHVPAKRSNIMSILNDEPEEPQPPRKKYANEAATALGPSSITASRSAYQPGGTGRMDETSIPSAVKSSGYGPQSQYPMQSRGYADYTSSYGPPGGASALETTIGWLDSTLERNRPPLNHSLSNRNHHNQPGHLNNLSVPSPAPTPPPASQRPYSNVFPQPAPAQAPVSSSSRDVSAQPATYRPVSPPSRSASVAFGSRQEPPTPAQSSASLYGIPPRQSSAQSFSPAAPSTAAPAQHSQSYQQHVQTLVNGSHNSHRSTPVSLSGGHASYDRGTPPPQTGRSMPPLATIGRSYTPPSAMHHSVAGGSMGYAPPPSAPPGPIPGPLHRPPGALALGDSGSSPAHHRVYSQGSSQGGLPGSLHPSSQAPR
ncbi:hypothetical protein N7468_007794 [Penicillium chermesinum]|uniref:SANT domain-containing protein n=1 Tax=Penicillium chermesinum TaxID=63820 RepID=A0A9W9NNH9_9EURO|nr:uncharacterized protein N7468_007794 [Penicillium chermesinum]KAJ5223252.1 hypothetical protein N7468_007794 [Penicillium chermesinum]